MKKKPARQPRKIEVVEDAPVATVTKAKAQKVCLKVDWEAQNIELQVGLC